MRPLFSSSASIGATHGMTAKLRYSWQALALVIFMGLGSTAPNAENAGRASSPFDVVRVALDRIQADYVDPVDDWKLVEGGLAGMADLPGLQSRLDFRGRLAAAQNAKLNRDGVVGLLASAFDQVRAEIHDDRLVSTAAIDGMLRALDLHSRFIEQEQLTSPTGQLIGGVGLNVRNDAGNVRVVSPGDASEDVQLRNALSLLRQPKR